MSAVVELVATATLREASSRQLSASVRLDALLADGRRIVLLDDRGWSSSLRGDVPADLRHTVDDLEGAALTVVGPDGPVEGETQAEMDALHWAMLAEKLAAEDVVVAPQALAAVPHEVVLDDALLALTRPADDERA